MIKSFLFQRQLCAVLIGLFVISCGSTDDKQKATSHSVDSLQFSGKVEAEYAKGFCITYHKNYKLLEVLNPFQNQDDTLRYSLVPRESLDQVHVANTQEIAIPIRSLIATSTTHVALAQMLNADNIITGMSGAKYVYSDAIKKRIKKGKITTFPIGELNKENVLAMQPDLLMISGGQSSQFNSYRLLMNSGISVMVNAEWLETTPLGKAEWIKVMAALLNKEEVANKKFDAVAKRYNKLKSSVHALKRKPLIINNIPYKGSWFVSGGDSYIATFLKDAGAKYTWGNVKKTGALQKDFEIVYELGLKADIWINPGSAKSKKDILAKDTRFKDFKSFKNGQIYNNNRRKRPETGNDFWESGVVHPEIILADMIKIFHPEVLPDHRLYYYQKLD